MRREIVIATAALLLMGTATRSSAQTRVGVRGYFTYGSTSFAAGDSFEAVADTSTQTGMGGGGSVSGLWRGLFVDVGVSQQRVDGERVFLNARQRVSTRSAVDCNAATDRCRGGLAVSRWSGVTVRRRGYDVRFLRGNSLVRAGRGRRQRAAVGWAGAWGSRCCHHPMAPRRW